MPLGVSTDNGNTWIKYSDFKKEDFADKFKETYDNRKKEYFKSNPLEVEKDKLFVKKQVPQEYVRKVAEEDNKSFEPTDKIFYTIKRGKENKLADYSFYNNGKKIITLNRYTSKWDIIDNDKGRFCYYLMKYLTHNSGAKIEEMVKNSAKNLDTAVKNIITDANKKYPGNIKLIKAINYRNGNIPYMFMFIDNNSEEIPAQFRDGKLSEIFSDRNALSDISEQEKLSMANKIKYFLSEFKRINRKDLIEKKKNEIAERNRRKELFNY
jgi:hypothetical protein